DLDVIATTLTRLLLANTQDVGRLSLSSDSEALGFWRPALTASSRLRLSSERILPDLMSCLGGTAGEDDPFSSVEFYRFRDNLFPASGFQSAQFRLIQRAFGKSGLFSLRLFPAQAYANQNTVSRTATTTVVHRQILGQSAQVAPPTD